MENKAATTGEPILESPSAYVLAKEDNMSVQNEDAAAVVLPEASKPNKDILVAAITATRFIAAGTLISAAANMHGMNPSTHYMIAGILLFASQMAEYLDKSIEVLTFAFSTVGSILIVIVGAIAVDRQALEISIIGAMWGTAALCLTIAHSYDAYLTYGKPNSNVILDASKVFAIIGTLFFTMAGIIMYSLDDVAEENIHNFADMFAYGGICYIVHTVTLACGHQVILERIFTKEREGVEYTSPSIA